MSMTSAETPAWRDKLSAFRVANEALFDQAFLAAWGDERWQPGDADRMAASELHVQLISRITTQRLGYTDGDEVAALSSVHALFDKARGVTGAHPGCRHVDTLVWHVINTFVRPFTAKWHRQSERGALAALDATDQFRAELIKVQSALSGLDDLLVEIRDGRPPPAHSRAGEDERERRIADAMARPLPWGIDGRLGGIEAADAARINAAEQAAIRARRQHYGLDVGKTHALGLAVSGGGIRSATFALGVFVALARRNLLHQFDYLSTVSGGGYLGSFLTTYLSSEQAPPPGAPAIGLRRHELPFRRDDGEAEALRHIRHFSKYLATGSPWERATMTIAQVYGMAVNGLGIAYLGVCAALIELVLRPVVDRDGLWTVATFLAVGALALASIVLPVCLRLARGARDQVDRWLAVPAVVLLGLVAWKLMGGFHALYDAGTKVSVNGAMSASAVALIAAALIPLLASAIVGLLGRLAAPIRVILTVIAAIAAPVFILGVDLAAYEWAQGSPWRTVALAALAGFATLILLFVLDINFTSPHRHYRKKLAEAYLIQPARRPQPAAPFDSNVSLPLSKTTVQARGPYHLINCALNVPGSRDPAMQGRLTDFFVFSQAFCGSPLVGYEATSKWEAADPHLDVGTAMAISGAAAAPQMGLSTSRQLAFWLALLNIRLSYWLRDPRRLSGVFATPTLYHLFSEMFSLTHENGRFLNLSDGGHIENLGVYELLRRRCKLIVAVDGEHDAQMTFHALTTLQRLAYIDLGVTIDINLDDLRLDGRGMSRSHFCFCRIGYPQETRDAEPVYGYLIYVKLSLTGNEGEFLRRYRLDEPSFPHHSTADQLFTEAQFEAYRSLGEHVGDKLFLPAIIGDVAGAQDLEVEAWFTAIGKSMLGA